MRYFSINEVEILLARIILPVQLRLLLLLNLFAIALGDIGVVVGAVEEFGE